MLWSTVLKKGTSLQFSPPTHLKITQVTLREGKGSCRVLVSYFDIAQNDDVTVPFASVSTTNPNLKTNLVLEEGQDVTLSVDADCTISLVGFYIIEEDDEDFQFEGDEDDEDLMDSFITDGDGEIEEEDDDDEEDEEDVKMKEEAQTKAKKDYVVALKDKSTPAVAQQKAVQPQKKVQPVKVEEKKQQQPPKKEVPKEQPQAKNKFTLSGGVEVEVLKQGSGNSASRGKRVTVRYTGRLAKNQKVFDSGSIPFKLGAGEVIKGWDLGIDGMKIGEKRKLTIPPALAYGNKGAGRDIPGGSTLIFDVELLKC